MGSLYKSIISILAVTVVVLLGMLFTRIQEITTAISTGPFVPPQQQKTVIEQSHTVSKEEHIGAAEEVLRSKVLLSVPHILQYPELPRGCEVTSLTMLLQYAGIKVDKMTLAEEITKDTTPYQRRNNQIYFGNPNTGFVGSMTNKNMPGYGVYHKPIKELLERYMPGQSVDLTGQEFNNLLYFVSQDIPVWIITNTTYSELKLNEFELWNTPSGVIPVTKKEHSVVIVGYDEENIYFNDPLDQKGKGKKIDRKSFEAAWIQMGRQAVTYKPLTN